MSANKSNKIATVNVIESDDLDEITSVTSFSDTPEGNKDAEEMFISLILKNGANKSDVASYVDDGSFSDGPNKVYLIHSN